MTDYEAEKPATLPAYHKGRAITPGTILVTATKFCPKCGRPTYITFTDDPRPPYDKVGCFHSLCGYVEPCQSLDPSASATNASGEPVSPATMSSQDK